MNVAVSYFVGFGVERCSWTDARCDFRPGCLGTELESVDRIEWTCNVDGRRFSSVFLPGRYDFSRNCLKETTTTKNNNRNQRKRIHCINGMGNVHEPRFTRWNWRKKCDGDLQFQTSFSAFLKCGKPLHALLHDDGVFPSIITSLSSQQVYTLSPGEAGHTWAVFIPPNFMEMNGLCLVRFVNSIRTLFLCPHTLFLALFLSGFLSRFPRFWFNLSIERKIKRPHKRSRISKNDWESPMAWKLSRIGKNRVNAQGRKCIQPKTLDSPFPPPFSPRFLPPFPTFPIRPVRKIVKLIFSKRYRRTSESDRESLD